MLRLRAKAWELIDIPDLTPRTLPVFSQIDSNTICILGGNDLDGYCSHGVILNAETCSVVRVINPVSEIRFTCTGQSFMKTAGEIVSLVLTNTREVHLICYNQAKNRITTIQDYKR